MGHKIATCSYCGTRAALVLGGHERHELACSSCGAPLHDLRAMPVADGASRKSKKKKKASGTKAAKPPPHRLDLTSAPALRAPRMNRRLKRKLIKKAFDLIEDVFD